jgi:uncharacterized protein (TIGR02611 family)
VTAGMIVEGKLSKRVSASLVAAGFVMMAATPPMLRLARKVAVAIAGGCVVLVGILLVMVPFPGPALVVIPLGLALLATEFSWAGRLLESVKERAASGMKWGRRLLSGRCRV